MKVNDGVVVKTHKLLWELFCWVLRPMGGRRGRDRNPNYVGRGRDRDRKLNFVACTAWIVSGSAVVAWGTESYLGLALRTSVLGMGQTVRLGKTSTLICKSRIEIYIFLVLWFFIFYFIMWVFFLFGFYSLCYVFRIAKWWQLPWVAVVRLVRESPRAPWKLLGRQAPVLATHTWLSFLGGLFSNRFLHRHYQQSPTRCNSLPTRTSSALPTLLPITSPLSL